MTRASLIVAVISLTLAGTLLASNARSQRLDQAIVSTDIKGADLNGMLHQISAQTGFNFVYANELGHLAPIALSVRQQTLDKVLAALSLRYRLRFDQINTTIAVTRLPPTAKPGRISGKVFDEKGDALPGATIKVTETGTGLQSAVDGSYSISLPPGTYHLEVSFVSYQSQQVTGVVVAEDKITYLNLALKPANTTLNGVTVTASYRNASTNGLYARRKGAADITDGISAEQIVRTPDKNLGESLKRVSGVNMIDNRFVVVRGLGERYNSSMLNGQLLPSTELNRKQFSFDVIPSNMVDNVTIYKTITPDKSAEFGGGLVEVNTKTVPDENYLAVTVGSTINDKTTGKLFRAQALGASSYLGSATSDRYLFGRNDWKNVDDIRTFYTASGHNANLLSNNWKIYNYHPVPSPNLMADYGHVFSLKNNDRLGIMASVSYRNTWQTADVKMGRNGYTGQDAFDQLYGYSGKRYGFTSNLGGIAGAGYSGSTWKASWQTIYMRTYDQQLQLGTGLKDDYGPAVGYFDLTTQTSLLQNQLKEKKHSAAVV